MSKNCTVTVLMSVHNGETFLRQCIDSILNQTFTDFEFVIYDDCSTDRTNEIIMSYADSRIVYRRNAENQGLTKSLNDGVTRSNAKYIARMDADDIAYPERLEKQVRWMEEHPDISILGSSVNYFKETPGNGAISKQPSDDIDIKATLFISFTLLHPSIMIRKADLIKTGINYNPDFRYSQDHALYLDCIKAGLKFANISEPLLYMRAHKGSISQHHSKTQKSCSLNAREIFLTATGIASKCSESEISVFNHLAVSEYPKNTNEVHLYEQFVEKVCSNPATSKYFDVELLREMMSEALCDRAYYMIPDKSLRQSVLEARKSPLRKYCKPWSLKQRIKFQIKKLIYS